MNLLPLSRVVLMFLSILTPAYALDCEPLDPRQQVGEKASLSIEGSAKTLFKILKADGSFRQETEQEVKNIYNDYPNADKIVINGKLIYMLCTLLDGAKDLDSNKKFSMFAESMRTIMESPELSSKSSSARENRRSAALVFEENDFVFELQQCKSSGRSIKCILLITNIGLDRILTLHANSFGISRIFLPTGDVAIATEVQVGSSKSKGHAQSKLLSNVITKASVTFSKVDYTGSKLSALEIPANDFSVQYRNIILIK